MGWTFSEVLSRHEVCEASSFGTVVVGVSSREHDLATPLTLCFYPEKGSEPDGPRLLKLHRRGCCAFFRVTLAALDIPDESFEVSVSKVLNNFPVAGTKEALPLAQQWLEACEKTHSRCQAKPVNYTPTRLVSTKPCVARICYGADLPISTRYTTLSHCWGEGSFTTLLRANMETFRKRVADDALSQTIKDAIEISWSLGFAYIWIDTRYSALP
jgi:hypothetical protein